MILAVGLLQFGVSPIFLVLQDAEDRAGMPFAAGNGCHALLVQLPGDDKAALAGEGSFKNPFDHFGLRRIDHQFALFVFVIAEKSHRVDR